jgi:hypothetical protein
MWVISNKEKMKVFLSEADLEQWKHSVAGIGV